MNGPGEGAFTNLLLCFLKIKSSFIEKTFYLYGREYLALSTLCRELKL
jgi:hypothetical protein